MPHFFAVLALRQYFNRPEARFAVRRFRLVNLCSEPYPDEVHRLNGPELSRRGIRALCL